MSRYLDQTEWEKKGWWGNPSQLLQSPPSPTIKKRGTETGLKICKKKIKHRATDEPFCSLKNKRTGRPWQWYMKTLPSCLFGRCPVRQFPAPHTQSTQAGTAPRWTSSIQACRDKVKHSEDWTVKSRCHKQSAPQCFSYMWEGPVFPKGSDTLNSRLSERDSLSGLMM